MNQTAIQAISSPLQAISQAFPLIQQQTEDIGIAVKAVRSEAHSSGQVTQDFRETVLRELTRLTDSVASSPSSLETAIRFTMDRYSTRMNQINCELQAVQSRDTGELLAKLDAMAGTIDLITAI